MAFKPTPQQDEIVTGSKTGEAMVIQAGAGSGKTSTLKLISGAMPTKKVLFVAYNKAIQVAAAKSFPRNTTCKTSHALAFGAVGIRYKDRLDAPRQTSRDVARILYINEPERIKDSLGPLSPQQLARITMETVKRFCYSDNDAIAWWHVPQQPGLEDKADHKALTKVIVPIAERAWKDIEHEHGRLRFEHDFYLKIWALSNPQIGADIVLLDEAQDSNKCVAAVVMNQRNAQVIMVGDSAQSIYGWRGASDAMQTFHGKQYLLSQSFRFGPNLAHEANKWLDIIEAPLRLTGFDQIPTVLAPLDMPDAVLCRTNAGAIRQAMLAFDAGCRPALVGGGEQIRRLAQAALDLKSGRPTSHPELYLFPTWGAVQDYAENDSSGSDLKSFVKLIDDHGAEEIIDVVGNLADERYADRIISTAHKAKGLEWGKVLVADDFREPMGSSEDVEPKVSREEAMLAYVTVTRAQRVLDRGGLAYVDKFGPGGRIKPEHRGKTKMQREQETIVIAAADEPDPLLELIAMAGLTSNVPSPEPRRTRSNPAATKHLLYGDTLTKVNQAPAETASTVLDAPVKGEPLPAPRSTCTCGPAEAKRYADLTGQPAGPDVERCYRCGGGRSMA